MSGLVLRPAARAIVVHDSSLLAIRRAKPSQRYMVIPGGRIEDGETPEATVLRELAEETMVVAVNPQLVFIEEPNDRRWGTQYIYLCEYVSGQPQLHPDSEEFQSNINGSSFYEPLWFPLNQFPDSEFPFRSAHLGEQIIAGLQDGFPQQPKQWTLEPPVVE